MSSAAKNTTKAKQTETKNVKAQAKATKPQTGIIKSMPADLKARLDVALNTFRPESRHAALCRAILADFGHVAAVVPANQNGFSHVAEAIRKVGQYTKETKLTDSSVRQAVAVLNDCVSFKTQSRYCEKVKATGAKALTYLFRVTGQGLQLLKV